MAVPGGAAAGASGPGQGRPARKRALLIGINYIGQKGQLRGCINDAQNMKRLLLSRGFPESEIRLLSDDQQGYYSPTRANMLLAMDWLVADARPGDVLCFHYSGHGGQERDATFKEEDGMNETILPVDHGTAGQIIDDILHDKMCRPLPAGVTFLAVFDSCHSGTVLDLPYVYKDPLDKNAHKGEHAVAERHAFMVPFVGLVGNALVHAGAELFHQGRKHVARHNLEKDNNTRADVFQISGSRDSQTSADATINGMATGAMSYALIKTLNSRPISTYTELIRCMRQELRGQYSQVPQLSYGKHYKQADIPFFL